MTAISSARPPGAGAAGQARPPEAFLQERSKTDVGRPADESQHHTVDAAGTQRRGPRCSGTSFEISEEKADREGTHYQDADNEMLVELPSGTDRDGPRFSLLQANTSDSTIPSRTVDHYVVFESPVVHTPWAGRDVTFEGPCQRRSRSRRTWLRVCRRMAQRSRRRARGHQRDRRYQDQRRGSGRRTKRSPASDGCRKALPTLSSRHTPLGRV